MYTLNQCTCLFFDGYKKSGKTVKYANECKLNVFRSQAEIIDFLFYPGMAESVLCDLGEILKHNCLGIARLTDTGTLNPYLCTKLV